MRVLVTARYIEGTSREGGSGRFMKTVKDTLEEMGHDVIATNTPNVMADYDCIIVSHHEQFKIIKGNEARKVYVSHGTIQDERPLSGADKYISVSEEVKTDNLSRGIDSMVIPQPIKIGVLKRPSDELQKILIIRAYDIKDDPFARLSKKYDVRISNPDIPIEDQIAWADLCITLGRGALESFTQGKPCIIADNRFYIGTIGDGYVAKKNIEEIAKFNFSGRCYKFPITDKWLEGELAKYNPDDSEFLYQYVKDNHDATKIVPQYLKTTPVHIVTAFYRTHLLNTIIHHYEPMDIVWHPIVFESERVDWPDKEWIQPFIIPDNEKVSSFIDIGYYKNNAFIRPEIVNDDYYIFLDDDDMIEKQAVRSLKELNDNVVFISLKRGYDIPERKITLKKYGVSTLTANPENVKVGEISKQQYVTKGKVFKRINFLQDIHFSDGIVGVWLKENYDIRYEPDLYALFNYFEPGRWNKPDFAFGCLINDIYRFNTVFRKSDLPGNVHYVKNPESATKGINILLDIIKNEGAKIGIIAHQDMYFRNGWTQMVREQLKALPDSWVVAGIIGKDMQGRICGNIHDMRIVDHIATINIHDFPQPAASFDECALIFNMEKDFRFDETLDGFDLYGTLCVLQTWEMEGTAWIINAFAEHYCMRPFTWAPDDIFKKRYKMLYDRFIDKFGVIESTVFVSKPRFETAAGP